MHKLEKIENIADSEQFKKVVSFETAGFSQPTVAMNDKDKMLLIITLNYTLIESLAETDQFIEGLRLSGLLQCLRQHP